MHFKIQFIVDTPRGARRASILLEAANRPKAIEQLKKRAPNARGVVVFNITKHGAFLDGCQWKSMVYWMACRLFDRGLIATAPGDAIKNESKVVDLYGQHFAETGECNVK